MIKAIDWPAGERTMERLIRPERILAIGGSKHFAMLSYEGATRAVAVPVSGIKWKEYDSYKSPDNVVVNVEVYRVEHLRNGTHPATKKVYVHESLTNDQAIDELKEGLLQMFIGQPYNE